MSEAAVKTWQTERQITVEGSSLRPIQSFSQTGILPGLPSGEFWESCLSGEPPSHYALLMETPIWKSCSPLNSSVFFKALQRQQTGIQQVLTVLLAPKGFQAVSQSMTLQHECRTARSNAACDQVICFAVTNPGPVPSHRHVRQGPSGHCCHRVWEDHCFWIAMPKAHTGSERCGGQHR